MQSKNTTQNKNKDYNYTQIVLNVGGLMIDSTYTALLFTNLSFHFLGGEWHTSDWMKKRFWIPSCLVFKPVIIRANASKERDSLFKSAVWIIMTKKENMGHCKTWTRQFTQKTLVFSKYLIKYYNITDIAELKP